MKKIAIAASIAAAFLLPQAPASAETVKVGVIGTFSGGFARWGQQFKEAIAVYQKQNGDTINGNKIEVIYRDDGGADPAKSRQLVEELIIREKVKFIAGFPWSPNALAAADPVTEAKIPTVIFNAATSVITRRSPYFIRTSTTMAQGTEPVAAWAPKHGYKKVVIAVADFASGIDAEKAFTDRFKADGGEILESIRIPLSTSDFAPFMERVLAKKPDAMFVFGPAGPWSVGIMNGWATRLKNSGIQLLCTNETQEIDLPPVGPAAIGAIGGSHYMPSLDNPMNAKLKADLTAMFGNDRVADIGTVGAYDGMAVIYAIVKKLGPNFNPDEAMKVAAGLKFESPRGMVEIDSKERDIIQNIYINKVVEKNGRLTHEVLETIPMVRDPWKDQNK